MPAGRYDILIEQGADLALTLTWRDSTGALVNLTGYSAKLYVRHTVDDADPPLIKFDSVAGQAGTITLGGAQGTIVLGMTAVNTTALAATVSGDGHVYDLELTSGAGVVTRLVQGRLVISREVTR